MREFAQTLIRDVRDGAISACDGQLHSNARGPVATRWRKAAAEGPEELAKAVIVDCVDAALFELLDAIDNERLNLFFQASNGKTISLRADGLGEMGGWFAGSGGWHAMFAKERYFDDFAHLLDTDQEEAK